MLIDNGAVNELDATDVSLPREIHMRFHGYVVHTIVIMQMSERLCMEISSTQARHAFVVGFDQEA